MISYRYPHNRSQSYILQVNNSCIHNGHTTVSMTVSLFLYKGWLTNNGSIFMYIWVMSRFDLCQVNSLVLSRFWYYTLQIKVIFVMCHDTFLHGHRNTQLCSYILNFHCQSFALVIMSTLIVEWYSYYHNMDLISNLIMRRRSQYLSKYSYIYIWYVCFD